MKIIGLVMVAVIATIIILENLWLYVVMFLLLSPLIQNICAKQIVRTRGGWVN